MNKYLALTIYAILIIATGAILMSLAYAPSRTIQYTVGIGMLISAVFAAITAYLCRNLTIALHYHGLHAMGMLVYGSAILFFATDVQKFFKATVFFLLYYGFAEVIFCFQLLEKRQAHISSMVVGSRMAIGFLITMGAVLLLATTYIDQNRALLISGGVFAFSGVNLLLFKSVFKKLEYPNNQPVIIKSPIPTNGSE